MARIYGTQGDDELIGTEGFDKIAGRGGNDVLIGYGYEHGDWIFGGAGNDQLSGSIASDRLHGGDGNDWIFGDSDRGDLTYFDGADDRIWGGAGDDYLDGMNGDDVIAAGPGNDWVQDAIGDTTTSCWARATMSAAAPAGSKATTATIGCKAAPGRRARWSAAAAPIPSRSTWITSTRCSPTPPGSPTSTRPRATGC
jgi:hypothetical protein